MLEITIPGDEFFDKETQTFSYGEETVLALEHSLAAISKWEQIWEKPFIVLDPKTPEEQLSYMQCMLTTPDVAPEVLYKLTKENIEEINEYINAKMTATWFRDRPKKNSTETITAELVYYWMFTLNIPLECEHWHLQKLFTTIKIFDAKNAPEEKRSFSEMAAERRALNEKRLAEAEKARAAALGGQQ